MVSRIFYPNRSIRFISELSQLVLFLNQIVERAPRLPTSVGMLPGRERDLWTWERADTPDHNLSFDRICEAPVLREGE